VALASFPIHKLVRHIQVQVASVGLTFVSTFRQDLSSGSAVYKIKQWNRLVTTKTCFLSFWQKLML